MSSGDYRLFRDVSSYEYYTNLIWWFVGSEVAVRTIGH